MEWLLIIDFSTHPEFWKKHKLMIKLGHLLLHYYALYAKYKFIKDTSLCIYPSILTMVRMHNHTFSSRWHNDFECLNSVIQVIKRDICFHSRIFTYFLYVYCLKENFFKILKTTEKKWNVIFYSNILNINLYSAWSSSMSFKSQTEIIQPN